MSLLNYVPLNTSTEGNLFLSGDAFSGDMTPASIIQSARYVMQDLRLPSRQPVEELLPYVMDALREAVIIKPALFAASGDVTCVTGSVEQSLTFASAVVLLEAVNVVGGGALTPFDVDTMNAFLPEWRSREAGVATQWARFPNDPLRFYIDRKAPAHQQIHVRYVRNPGSFALDEIITDLPHIYRPALIYYVVYRSEMKDSEHVLSQRAAQVYAQFVALIKG